MTIVKLTKKKTELIAVLLLLITFVQLVYIITATSPVLDEQFYPGVAKYTVTTGDFTPFAYRFHPPVAYYINSLFLYTDNNPVWQLKPFDMTNILQAYNLSYYFFLTRLPIALVSLLLGICIFKWSRKLYGDKAALFSLFLFTFEPTMLANGAVATTDLTVAAFAFIALYFLWNFLNKRTDRNAVLAGLFLGLALASKFTALILVPFAFVLLLYFLKGSKIKLKLRLIVIYFAIAFLVIWALYGFQVSTIDKTVHSVNKSEEFLNSTFSAGEVGAINTVMNLPLPAATYFTALGYNLYHSVVGHGAYLFGSYETHGWLYYYILAFAVKATIPFLALLLVFAYFIVIRKEKLNREEKFLLLTIGVFFVFLSLLKLNIGLRHLLLIYPLIFLLLGKLATVKIPKVKQKFYYALIAVLALWIVLEAVMIAPYDISYFNEFVGGPKNGYLYLSDTDVDWGQWLGYLSTYAKENNLTSMYLTAPLPAVFTDYYVSNYTYPSCTPKNGLYAVGVSFLMLYDHFDANHKDCLQWLRNYTPQNTLGYSVLIYNISNVTETTS